MAVVCFRSRTEPYSVPICFAHVLRLRGEVDHASCDHRGQHAQSGQPAARARRLRSSAGFGCAFGRISTSSLASIEPSDRRTSGSGCTITLGAVRGRLRPNNRGRHSWSTFRPGPPSDAAECYRPARQQGSDSIGSGRLGFDRRRGRSRLRERDEADSAPACWNSPVCLTAASSRTCSRPGLHANDFLAVGAPEHADHPAAAG